MSIYMKVPGVEGSVNTEGYTNWIELTDLHFLGIDNVVSMRVGQASDRYNTQPVFKKLTAMKVFDKSSIALFQAAHDATIYPSVEIHYITTGNPPYTYSKMELSNVAFTHYSERYEPGAGYPEECLHIAYTKIQRSYIPRNQSHNPDSPLITGYDLEKAQAI